MALGVSRRMALGLIDNMALGYSAFPQSCAATRHGAGSTLGNVVDGERPMEIHQVWYFLSLTRTRNFTLAPEICHVTRPALTKAAPVRG